MLTTISDLEPAPTADITGPPADGLIPLARRADGLVGSIIDSSTSLLAQQRHDIVRFAMGAPAADVTPWEQLRDLARDVYSAGSFTYGATEGEPVLLTELTRYAKNTAEPVDTERTVITTGGMQGLDLAFKLFVDPGDLVVIESPTYTNGSGTALSYGADLLEVPVDEDGLDVERLESLVAKTGRRPKAIYTIPNFQNPSGVSMAHERRVRLVELARLWGSVIVDDDPYGLLRFEGAEVPGFPALMGEDPLLFSVRTFSKVLAPGLRVGWVSADARLRPLLVGAKQAMDTCTNVPNQHVVAEFLRTGALEGHLEWLRCVYRTRKEAMQSALREHLGDRVRTTDPQGGFFLWVTLQGEDARIDTRRLFDVALEEGVAFIPGPALSPSQQFADSFRLCFASTTPERTHVGVARLRRALDRARREAGVRS